MVWILGENSVLLIMCVGVSLCKNMGPILSRVYCIYFESTHCNVYSDQLLPLCMNSRVQHSAIGGLLRKNTIGT